MIDKVKEQYLKSKHQMFDEWCEENSVDEKTKNDAISSVNKGALKRILFAFVMLVTIYTTSMFFLWLYIFIK